MDLEINSNYMCEYIQNIIYIANWYVEEISKISGESFYSETVDTSKLEVNPYFNKVDDGIGVEFYYGIPSYLWTKFGRVRLTGSCTHYDSVGKNILHDFVQRFIEKFDCVQIRPLTKNFDGEHGPVYQINQVGNFNVSPVIGHRTYSGNDFNQEKFRTIKNMLNNKN